MFNKKEYNANYYKSNSEQIRANAGGWYKENTEQAKAYAKKHYTENTEQKKSYAVRYRDGNTEKMRVYGSMYQKTDSGKESRRKTDAKRKNFGFIPLNEPFLNCRGHHITVTYVIYIPKDMHTGTRHSVTKDRNMKEINTRAFKFLIDNSKAGTV